MSPDELPVAGEVIEATVRFTNVSARRRCLVTRVKTFEIQGHPPVTTVIGRFQTNTGVWSAKERALQGPYARVPS
jgi:hypothetical protein